MIDPKKENHVNYICRLLLLYDDDVSSSKQNEYSKRTIWYLTKSRKQFWSGIADGNWNGSGPDHDKIKWNHFQECMIIIKKVSKPHEMI